MPAQAMAEPLVPEGDPDVVDHPADPKQDHVPGRDVLGWDRGPLGPGLKPRQDGRGVGVVPEVHSVGRVLETRGQAGFLEECGAPNLAPRAGVSCPDSP